MTRYTMPLDARHPMVSKVNAVSRVFLQATHNIPLDDRRVWFSLY